MISGNNYVNNLRSLNASLNQEENRVRERQEDFSYSDVSTSTGIFACYTLPLVPYYGIYRILRDSFAWTHHKIARTPSLNESQNSLISRILFPGMEFLDNYFQTNLVLHQRLIQDTNKTE